jgi:hypothetical protein
LVRFVVFERFAVFGRFIVLVRLGVVLRPVLEVFVRPAVPGRLVFVLRPAFVLCDGVEWVCEALCEGALDFAGAFGALPLCSWLPANAGIAIASRSTNEFCSIRLLRGARTCELEILEV